MVKCKNSINAQVRISIVAVIKNTNALKIINMR